MKHYNFTIPKFVCMVAVMLIGFTASSQKVKNDEIGIFNYDQPRMSKKLDGTQTYHVIAEVNGDRAYRRRILEDQVDIEPFTRADANADPDFTINIKEAPVFFSEPKREIKSRKVDGVTVNYYYYKGEYTAKANLKIETKEGVIVFNERIEVHEFVKGEAMKSSSQAKDDFLEHKSGWKEQAAEKIVARVNSKVKSQFTNIPKSLKFYMAKVSSKKVNYDDYTAALETQKQVFLDYQINKSVTDEMSVVLESNKQAWMAMLKESDTANKKARINKKVTAAVKYHLGFTHFLLGEYKDANTMYRQSGQLEKFVVFNAPTWMKMVDDVEARYANWEDELD